MILKVKTAFAFQRITVVCINQISYTQNHLLQTQLSYTVSLIFYYFIFLFT